MDLIERYVRFPASLGADQRRDVENLLRRSPTAAMLCDSLMELYADVDRLELIERPRVDAFVEKLLGRDGDEA